MLGSHAFGSESTICWGRKRLKSTELDISWASLSVLFGFVSLLVEICGLISHERLTKRKLFVFLQENSASYLASQIAELGKSIFPPLILLLIFSQSKTPSLSRRATHLYRPLYQLHHPQSNQEYWSRKARGQVWLLPHAYTHETQAHCSLCTAIITYVFTPFSCRKHHYPRSEKR